MVFRALTRQPLRLRPLTVLIAAGEIRETGGLAGLIALVQARLEEWESARRARFAR